MPMNDNAGLYREFEEALTEVLAEKEYSLDRRTRLAKARAVTIGTLVTERQLTALS
jgi:hypothetical protein